MRENLSSCILSRDNTLGALRSLFYYSDINLCFQFTMLGGKCAIYDCSSTSATPAVAQYRDNTEETTFIKIITSGSVIDDNLKSQIKNRTLNTTILVIMFTTRVKGIVIISNKMEISPW